MSDANTLIDDDLEAGFAGAETSTETPEADVQQAAEESDQQDDRPWYARVTEAQFSEIVSKANSVDTLKDEYTRKLDQAFGKIGSIQQLLAQKQAETPSGQSVEIDDEDLAELAEFPEIAAGLKNALSRVAGKMRGTGQAFDIDSAIAQRFESLKEETTVAVETKLLTRAHRDWKETIQAPEFQHWLSAKPQEFQVQLLSSVDSEFIGDALSEFKSARAAAPAKKTTARADRFAAAVNPRSSGGAPAGRSEDDEFDAGFNS